MKREAKFKEYGILKQKYIHLFLILKKKKKF